MSTGMSMPMVSGFSLTTAVVKSPPMKPRKSEVLEQTLLASLRPLQPGKPQPLMPLTCSADYSPPVKGSFGVVPPVPAEHYTKRQKITSRYSQGNLRGPSPTQQLHQSSPTLASPSERQSQAPLASHRSDLSPHSLVEQFREEDALYAKFMTRVRHRRSLVQPTLAVTPEVRVSPPGGPHQTGGHRHDAAGSLRAQTGTDSTRRPSSMYMSYVRPSFLEGLREPASPLGSAASGSSSSGGGAAAALLSPTRLRLSLVNENFRITDDDELFPMERQRSDSVDNIVIPQSHRSMSNPLSQRSSECTSTLSTGRVTDRAAGWNVVSNSEKFRARALLRRSSVLNATIDRDAALRDWNGEYQALLEQHTQGPAEAEAKARKMEALLESFRDTVTPIIETIVAERNTADKSVPLQPLGGIAGGDKYVVGNIVVKFAVTERTLRLYGSHERAVKSAGHELRGLNAVVSTELSILHVPLAMTVSYLGHVVWVASKLPIDNGTLKHGSRDGGKTMVSRADQAQEVVQKLGKVLNLKEHTVGSADICGPADLEIHLARDGRFYALDTARLMPPDCNPALGQAPNFFLFRALRQELVQSLPMALSSDACCAFGRHNRHEHDEEVRLASSFITNQLIPNLCRDVPQLFRTASVRECFDVAGVLHTCGINLRYLGLVVEKYADTCTVSGQAPLQAFVTHCVVEILSRSFRAVVSEQLFHMAPDSDRHLFVLDRFNDLLSPNPAFWTDLLLPCAVRKFPTLQQPTADRIRSLMSRCTIDNTWLSAQWSHSLLFQRSSQLLGAEWDVDAVRDTSLLAKFGGDPSTHCIVLVPPLLVGLVPVVRLCALSPYAAVHRLLAAGDLPGAEDIYLNELSVRSMAVGESVELATLLVNIVALYLMPQWGPGKPRIADAVKAAKRLVLIYQRIVLQDEGEALPPPPASHPLPSDTFSTTLGPSLSSTSGLSDDGGPDTPIIGYLTSLLRLSEVLRTQGEQQEAADVISTALKSYTLHGVQHKPLLCQLHMSAGRTWMHIGQLTFAYEALEAAVTLARGIAAVDFATDSMLRMAQALLLLAEVADALGLMKMALDVSAEAVAFTVAQNLPAPALALAHVTYAAVRWDGVQFVGTDADVQNVTSALAELKRLCGSRSIEAGRCLMVASLLSRERGHQAEGIRQCDEALSTFQYCCGTPSKEEAAALCQLSTFYFLPGIEGCQSPTPTTEDHSRPPLNSPRAQQPATPRSRRLSTPASPTTRRFGLATSLLQQARSVLTKLDATDDPLYARICAILADITRVSSTASARDVAEATKLITHSVQLLESLLMFKCRDYVYAVNVKALLRCQQLGSQSPISSIALLFQVLASSDRFMLVANSDFFTLENILALQTKCSLNTIAGRAKVTFSRDGQLRKLASMLLQSFMHLALHEVLETAMVVKQIIIDFRELFPPNAEWSPECATFLPKMLTIGMGMLAETGRGAGPVTDLADRMLKIREEETAKQEAVDLALRRRSACKQADDLLQERRGLEHRLQSQIKQVGMYFLQRNFANGLSLLHAVLHLFGDLHPEGADPLAPPSILSHNLIGHELRFARSEIRGHTRYAAFDGDLEDAERHADSVLRITHNIDPLTFEGLPPRGLVPKLAYKAEFLSDGDNNTNAQ